MKQFLAGCATAALITGLFQAGFAVTAQDMQGKQIIARAPFVVVGDQGEVLMDLSVGEFGPVLTIHGSNNKMVKLGSSMYGMGISAIDGQRYAQMQVQDGMASVSATFGGNGVVLRSGPEEQHLLIGADGSPVVDLGVKPGTNAALRIAAPNGGLVANIGSNPGNGGAGALYIGNADGQTAAAMVTGADGSGRVSVLMGGQDIVAMESNVSATGGKLTVADMSGNVRFNAGTTSGGDGAACVTPVSGDQKCF